MPPRPPVSRARAALRDSCACRCRPRAAKRQRRAITAGSSGATSGLASSLAFTPVQGMELANPEAAAARVKAANEKYFSSSSGFYSVVKQ